jgi:sugar lactone lactonase YvrE
LVGPIGYRVVRVDPDTRQVREFVFNPSMLPASRTGHAMALERPVDVKFGPDGALYILDFGEMTLRGSEERVTKRTGRIYRLAPETPATTQP